MGKCLSIWHVYQLIGLKGQKMKYDEFYLATSTILIVCSSRVSRLPFNIQHAMLKKMTLFYGYYYNEMIHYPFPVILN